MPWANRDREAKRKADARYNAEHRRNREEAMRRANWKCQLRFEGICIGAASQCDHVVAVVDGGGHELSNLRAACSPCHKARTAQQGRGFRRGDGTREDPACQPRTAW